MCEERLNGHWWHLERIIVDVCCLNLQGIAVNTKVGSELITMTLDH